VKIQLSIKGQTSRTLGKCKNVKLECSEISISKIGNLTCSKITCYSNNNNNKKTKLKNITTIIPIMMITPTTTTRTIFIMLSSPGLERYWHWVMGSGQYLQILGSIVIG